MRNFSPIALFAFNRPDTLQRTLDSLAKNTLAPRSALTIFCDGPRTAKKNEEKLTQRVQDIAQKTKGFASVDVVCREYNYGCANSIISGLTEMFAAHERLIVLEDDILCSPYTLQFLNDGLEKYQEYKTVFNISAWAAPQKILPIPPHYPFDVYFIPRFNCWGWASWRDRFSRIDWNLKNFSEFKGCLSLENAFNSGGVDLTPMLTDQVSGTIDAWDIRADFNRFINGCLGCNPVFSYTTNIGCGSGTHTTSFSSRYDNDVSLAAKHCEFPNFVFCDQKIVKLYANVYAASLPRRLILKLIPNPLKKYIKKSIQFFMIKLQHFLSKS